MSTKWLSPRPLNGTSLVRFLAEELAKPDLWVMILGSALMSVAFQLRSGARDRIYWRLKD